MVTFVFQYKVTIFLIHNSKFKIGFWIVVDKMGITPVSRNGCFVRGMLFLLK